MTQRFWQPYTPDVWNTFSEDEWATFLLEPGGVYGTVVATAGASTTAIAGSSTRRGTVSAVAGAATTVASGDVTPRRKTGSVLAVSDHALTVATGIVGKGGSIVAQASAANTAVAARRGIQGAVLAISGESWAGTPTGFADGLVSAQAGPATTVIAGILRKTIRGSVQAQAGEAATFIATDATRVVVAYLIESLRSIDSSYLALRNPVDAVGGLSRSFAMGLVDGSCLRWAVKRDKAEIELFYDDREVELVASGCQRT